MVDPTAPQPPPTGTGRPILELVVEDLRRKDEKGTLKYGTTLRARNGRQALVDAYQEQLDQVMYLRQQLEEDRDIAGRARAEALQEAITRAELLMHAEPQGQGDELSRIATYCNGTLRRLIAQLQALQGKPAPEPAPSGRRKFHRWRWVEKVARCLDCPVEKHRERGPQHGVVIVYRVGGREFSRGASPKVPPCRPGAAP